MFWSSFPSSVSLPILSQEPRAPGSPDSENKYRMSKKYVKQQIMLYYQVCSFEILLLWKSNHDLYLKGTDCSDSNFTGLPVFYLAELLTNPESRSRSLRRRFLDSRTVQRSCLQESSCVHWQWVPKCKCRSRETYPEKEISMSDTQLNKMPFPSLLRPPHEIKTHLYMLPQIARLNSYLTSPKILPN